MAQSFYSLCMSIGGNGGTPFSRHREAALNFMNFRFFYKKKKICNGMLLSIKQKMSSMIPKELVFARSGEASLERLFV